MRITTDHYDWLFLPLWTHTFTHAHTNHHSVLGWLLEFYVLATSKVLWVQILTGDRAPSLCLYSAAATGIMTQYPASSHYLDTEPTSPCTIPLMLRAWLWSDKYIIYKSFLWLDQKLDSRSPARGAHALPIWSPCLVSGLGIALSFNQQVVQG